MWWYVPWTQLFHIQARGERGRGGRGGGGEGGGGGVELISVQQGYDLNCSIIKSFTFDIVLLALSCSLSL